MGATVAENKRFRSENPRSATSRGEPTASPVTYEDISHKRQEEAGLLFCATAGVWTGVRARTKHMINRQEDKI